MDRNSLITYWYFHLPNFVLAALMYTLLGRAFSGCSCRRNSQNYIWRFFCRVTDPVAAAVAAVTPKAARPVVIWLFGGGLVFLAAARLFYRFQPPRPQSAGRRVNMNRNLYYVAIAFFGMVNGIPFFHPMYIFAFGYPYQTHGGSAVWQHELDRLFCLSDVVDGDHHLAGIPAAIYERLTGAKDNSTVASLWIWLAGTALLTLPAIGNFFQYGL